MKSVYRYQVPIDGHPHEIELTGPLVAVGYPGEGYVEFWAEHHEGQAGTGRTFEVFGTGNPIPDTAKWVGTCARLRSLVFHLYEHQ